MISSIWPSYNDIPNKMPASQGVTTQYMISYFIFWIIQFPVMFLHPTILRHLFVVKAVYTTAALFGAMGWAIAKNGGEIGGFVFQKQVVLSGSALVWPMIQAINSVSRSLLLLFHNAMLTSTTRSWVLFVPS